jgi:uncharacterized protein YjbI with pentapeptide repeats
MANKEHLQVLFESIASGGCRQWNDWRIDNPQVLPELMGLELLEIRLPFINLSKSDLRLASLCQADFYHANFENSDLSLAILENANLRQANMAGSKLFRASLRGANLGSVNLRGADLRGADLIGVRLRDADLTDIIIDSETLKQIQNLYEQGVSRLEKIALLLSKHKKVKRLHPAEVKATLRYLEDR